VGDIGLAAREKVIDTEDIVARLYESIAEMGAKEAGSTGDENFFLHLEMILSVTGALDVKFTRGCQS